MKLETEWVQPLKESFVTESENRTEYCDWQKLKTGHRPCQLSKDRLTWSPGFPASPGGPAGPGRPCPTTGNRLVK